MPHPGLYRLPPDFPASCPDKAPGTGESAFSLLQNPLRKYEAYPALSPVHSYSGLPASGNPRSSTGKISFFSDTGKECPAIPPGIIPWN